jgi:cyclic pyranopterin phosphate synthase
MMDIPKFEDRWQRKITYLRLSLTDRCNYRCAYCMPEEGFEKSEQEELLSFEELTRLIDILVRAFGIQKLRFTGGEPLVRAQMISLVDRIAQMPGIKELAMTTNGHLLDRFAIPLYQAGLRKLNVSIDSFDPIKFEKITRGGDLKQVLKGIKLAQSVGFQEIKINCVVLPEINENEWLDFCYLAWDLSLMPRFIELMPIGDLPYQAQTIPNTLVLQQLSHDLKLSPIEYIEPTNTQDLHKNHLLGPANYLMVTEGKYQGKLVGFINPLSDDGFCGRCNRIRLSAKGGLRACLADDREVDLKLALRNQWPEHLIIALIEEAVFGKKPKHLMNEKRPPLEIMTRIGG